MEVLPTVVVVTTLVLTAVYAIAVVIRRRRAHRVSNAVIQAWADEHGWRLLPPAELFPTLLDAGDSVAPSTRSRGLLRVRWLIRRPSGDPAVTALARVWIDESALGEPIDRSIISGAVEHTLPEFVALRHRGDLSWDVVAADGQPGALPEDVAGLIDDQGLLTLQLAPRRWCATVVGTDDLDALHALGKRIAGALATRGSTDA